MRYSKVPITRNVADDVTDSDSLIEFAYKNTREIVTGLPGYFDDDTRVFPGIVAFGVGLLSSPFIFSYYLIRNPISYKIKKNEESLESLV